MHCLVDRSLCGSGWQSVTDPGKTELLTHCALSCAGAVKLTELDEHACIHRTVELRSVTVVQSHRLEQSGH